MIVAFIAIGVVAGIIGGLLGISGGMITVPCLFYLFRLADYPQAYVMHMSIATSLAAMILNTASAAWAHNKRGAVLWNVVKKMVPGLIIGSVIGALIATRLSGVFLEVVFGVFLLFTSYFFFRKKPPSHETHKLPQTSVFMSVNACVGAVANILGIGGGTLTVPLLMAFRINDKKAIGSSSVASFVVSCLGSISYLIFGWGDLPTPENLGLINLPAFAIIGVTTLFLAPVGVKLTHQLPSDVVRKIFGVILVVTGLSLIF